MKRKQLLSIFDSINEVISVIDAETYEILYVNKFVRNRHGKDLVGGLCYKELHGLDSPCGHCTKEIAIGLRGEYLSVGLSQSHIKQGLSGNGQDYQVE